MAGATRQLQLCFHSCIVRLRLHAGTLQRYFDTPGAAAKEIIESMQTPAPGDTEHQRSTAAASQACMAWIMVYMFRAAQHLQAHGVRPVRLDAKDWMLVVRQWSQDFKYAVKWTLKLANLRLQKHSNTAPGADAPLAADEATVGSDKPLMTSVSDLCSWMLSTGHTLQADRCTTPLHVLQSVLFSACTLQPLVCDARTWSYNSIYAPTMFALSCFSVSMTLCTCAAMPNKRELEVPRTFLENGRHGFRAASWLIPSSTPCQQKFL